ncbi:hypothetical protein [Pelosinus sp. UFO1]|uniref:hypothetical protein n=1 Tax=Pelosinus sp. UFO1 TaxID=484770 RepID=UPI0004D11FA4|nr:hypothetical protein [Pelosinus sp. UFO1]AIF53684.1 hypothetical protein UFO1_4141 [Pelosinus sp. UFO1]
MIIHELLVVLKICIHHTYEKEDGKNEIAILYCNMQQLGIDGNRYVQSFNLEGLTSKLLH